MVGTGMRCDAGISAKTCDVPFGTPVSAEPQRSAWYVSGLRNRPDIQDHKRNTKIFCLELRQRSVEKQKESATTAPAPRLRPGSLRAIPFSWNAKLGICSRCGLAPLLLFPAPAAQRQRRDAHQPCPGLPETADGSALVPDKN
jgi:hypothetical protein